MVQIRLMRRRSWAGMAWLIVMATGALLGLALGNTIFMLAALAMGALAGLLALRAPARDPSAGAAGAPSAQCTVRTADGAVRQALLVPAHTAGGYRTVLTIDGYALIDAEGQVVYALSRAAQAEASDPVVVTILDWDAVESDAVKAA